MNRHRAFAPSTARLGGRTALSRPVLRTLFAAAAFSLLLASGCDGGLGQAVTGFALDKASATLFIGKTEQLSLTAVPSSAIDGATWASDKPLIASVNDSGLVTALAPGAAVITATNKSGLYKASCNFAIPNIRLVESNIAVSQTWEAGRTYYVTGNVEIASGATLTIQPGTTVKFGTESSLKANLGASINAAGTGTATGQAIVFTSFKDGSVGEAIPNLSGAAAKGDWLSVSVYGSGNVFAYCVFCYGGSGTPVLAITDWTGVANVSHCVFRDNKGAPNDPYSAALDASYCGAGTTITDNAFYRNEWPLIIGASIDLGDSNVFHDPADSTTVNAYQAVYLGGYYNTQWIFSANRSFTVAEVPLVTDKEIGVNSPATLTIGPSTAIKFMANGWIVVHYGAALSYTAASTVFTSIRDDSVKGDTDGPTTPAAASGDWAGIMVETGPAASTFDWRTGTAVRFATNP